MASKTRIGWAAAALRDLNAVHEYYGSRSPSAARRILRRIADAAELLETSPEAGAVADDVKPVGRYRHLVVRPYRLIYRLEGDRLWLLRVWDARRNPVDLRVPDLDSE